MERLDIKRLTNICHKNNNNLEDSENSKKTMKQMGKSTDLIEFSRCDRKKIGTNRVL